jgi:hypothetical protein
MILQDPDDWSKLIPGVMCKTVEKFNALGLTFIIRTKIMSEAIHRNLVYFFLVYDRSKRDFESPNDNRQYIYLKLGLVILSYLSIFGPHCEAITAMAKDLLNTGDILILMLTNDFVYKRLDEFRAAF